MGSDNTYTRVSLIDNCEVCMDENSLGSVSPDKYAIVLDSGDPVIMDIPLNAQVKLHIDPPSET